MIYFLKERTVIFLMLITLVIGVTLGSTITWLTVKDSGPPLSCLERGGVVVIADKNSVKCEIPDR